MKRTLSVALLSIALFVAVDAVLIAANAVTLSFTAPATVAIGQTFSLDVVVNSNDRGFNAGEATILFPNNILEVVSIDTVPSSTIFNFWLSTPLFANDKGTISFSGGTTHGVMGPAVQILSVHMRAKGSGEAIITASDASINASDGSGTNILDSIKALRIVVSGAAVIIPSGSSPTVTESTKAEGGNLATTTKANMSIKNDRCAGLFAGCELHYPTIDSVSVRLHTQVGADVSVSGTAPDGNHAHLQLSLDGIPYKEIAAIIQTDRKWEGSLANIYAYGTYTLSAWTENADGSQKSSVVEWDPIDIYPPFTLHPYGYVLRWYAVATAALGILAGIFGILLLWRYAVRREQYRTDAIVVAGAVASVAFIGMFIAAYILWQKEYRSTDTFWRDTSIPCILRAPSYIDVFSSVQLSIYVDGAPQPIPADIGFSPKCVAQIHTHDTTGRIHLQRTVRPVTLSDFFTVAGIPFEQKDHLLSVIVNGKDDTKNIGSYTLQNGDVIVVTYTTTSTTKNK